MDRVRTRVRRSDEEKARAAAILRQPLPGDAAGRERFEKRKRDHGFADREEIQTRADLIDADDGRRL